jgi:hypothetical protein
VTILTITSPLWVPIWILHLPFRLFRERKEKKERFAAIELRIGHLKSDFRLGRNFLQGQVGDAINLLLAAAASNLSFWMRQVLFALVSAIQNWAQECQTFHPPLPA